MSGIAKSGQKKDPEIFRRNKTGFPSGVKLVALPRSGISGATFSSLENVLSRLWRNFLLNMKNYIIGIVLLLAAGFLMLDPLQWQPRAVPVDDAPNEPDSPADASQSAGTPPSIEPESAETQVGNTPDENASSALSETTPITLGEEKLNYALENDYSLPSLLIIWEEFEKSA